MQHVRTLSRLVFVLFAAASFAACTTAPIEISDYNPAPKIKAPALTPKPLTSTTTPVDTTYGKGVLIDIPGNLFGNPPWRKL